MMDMMGDWSEYDDNDDNDDDDSDSVDKEQVIHFNLWWWWWHPPISRSIYNIHRSIYAFLTFSYNRYYVMNYSIDNMTKMTKASNMNELFRCHIKIGIFLRVKSIDHIEWNRTNLYHHPHHHQYILLLLFTPVAVAINSSSSWALEVSRFPELILHPTHELIELDDTIWSWLWWR